MNRSFKAFFLGLLVLFTTSCSVSYLVGEEDSAMKDGISITFPSEHYDEAVDGRLILLISDRNDTELRFQLRDDSKTCQAFGMDVNKWSPGVAMPFAMNSFGYPIRDMKDLPSGEYFVQALFHK